MGVAFWKSGREDRRRGVTVEFERGVPVALNGKQLRRRSPSSFARGERASAAATASA